MAESEKCFDDLTAAEAVELLDVYLEDWCHRDSLLWGQVFKFFYATLIVLFLPNIAAFIQIELPAFPRALFPACAMILSALFLYVSLGYCKRLEAAGRTYQRVIDKLPPDYRRVRLSDPAIAHGRFFDHRMSTVVCSFMFVGLLVLSTVMIVYNLSH